MPKRKREDTATGGGAGDETRSIKRAKSDFYQCRICKAEFKSATDIRAHLLNQRHISDDLSVDDEMLMAQQSSYLECPRCPKVFADALDLQRHIGLHVNPRKDVMLPLWSCFLCKKKFPTKAECEQHLTSHGHPELMSHAPVHQLCRACAGVIEHSKKARKEHKRVCQARGKQKSSNPLEVKTADASDTQQVVPDYILPEVVWDSLLLKREKQLLFALDIDKTLLASTLLDDISQRTEHFEQRGAVRWSVQASNNKVVEKAFIVRPGAVGLLRKLSDIGELVFFTTAGTAHACAAVEFLHSLVGFKKGVNVVSHTRLDSSTALTKELSRIVTSDELVVVIDDKVDTWVDGNPSSSLGHIVLVPPFDAFHHASHLEYDNFLDIVLNVALASHNILFDNDLASFGATTTTVMRAIRSTILQGSRLYFSADLHSSNSTVLTWSLPHQAQLLGASVVSSPTDASHIVVADVESLPRASVEQYLAAGSPRVVVWTWLTGCVVSWSRLEEGPYSPFPAIGELRMKLPHTCANVRSVEDLVNSAMNVISASLGASQGIPAFAPSSMAAVMATLKPLLNESESLSKPGCTIPLPAKVIVALHRPEGASHETPEHRRLLEGFDACSSSGSLAESDSRPRPPGVHLRPGETEIPGPPGALDVGVSNSNQNTTEESDSSAAMDRGPPLGMSDQQLPGMVSSSSSSSQAPTSDPLLLAASPLSMLQAAPANTPETSEMLTLMSPAFDPAHSYGSHTGRRGTNPFLVNASDGGFDAITPASSFGLGRFQHDNAPLGLDSVSGPNSLATRNQVPSSLTPHGPDVDSASSSNTLLPPSVGPLPSVGGANLFDEEEKIFVEDSDNGTQRSRSRSASSVGTGPVNSRTGGRSSSLANIDSRASPSSLLLTPVEAERSRSLLGLSNEVSEGSERGVESVDTPDTPDTDKSP